MRKWQTLRRMKDIRLVLMSSQFPGISLLMTPKLYWPMNVHSTSERIPRLLGLALV